MTQEEKAKRYDELLLKLQKAKVDNNVCDEMYYRVIDDIVPELKESEDEKIRESIIENLKGNMCRTDGDYDLLNKQIAWLEKQGEQKYAPAWMTTFLDELRSKKHYFEWDEHKDIEGKILAIIRWMNPNYFNEKEVNYPKFDYDDILAMQCCMKTAEKVTEDKELYEKLKSLHSRLHDAYWLDKQGEQKQDPCEHCNDRRLNCHNFPCAKGRAFKQGKSVFDIINEEKVDNTNKIETKFKVGDFVVIQETTYLISKIEGLNVTLSLNGREGIFDMDVLRNAHLYTIKDAKDGDVLYSPSHHLIWIYKDNEHYYACINMNYVTENVDTDGLISIPNDACPATKEQRKQLERAMADTGYTFDFEKKELKKIEDKIEIPFGAKDSELQEATYNIPKGFHAEIDDDKVVIKKGEKPTVWSKEDERQWNNIYDVLDGHFELSEEGYKNAATWFKAIKGRVQPQPKQEWSKDDKVMLDDIIDFFENGTVKLQHDLSLYASWLKSLKDRVQPQPKKCSEWDRSKIQRICKYLDEAKKYYADITEVRECIEWLKFLRPQYIWQPSDEQMEALEHFVRSIGESGYASHYDNNTKLLYSLLEQLKKLK